MRANGRRSAPRPRSGVGALRVAAVAASTGLLLAACGGSSGGLGEANGGIGTAGRSDRVTATESAAYGAGGENRDGPPPTTTTDPTTEVLAANAPTTSRPTGADGAGDPAGDPDRAARAVASGSVPGLGPDDPFHEVLAAYWSLLHRARQEPWTYDDTALDAVAVGAGRDRFVQRIDHLGAAESVVPPEDSIFEVRLSDLRVGSDVAVGEECAVDDFVRAVVRDARTGRRYEPPLVTDDRVFTHRYGVTFQRVDGIWKVADRVLIEEREGVGGCAAGW